MKTALVLVFALIAISHAEFNKVATCCSEGEYVKKDSSNACTKCAAWCASCDMAQDDQKQDGKKENKKACPCKDTTCKVCSKDKECDTCKDGYIKITNAKVCTACTAASKCKTCTDPAAPEKCATCNTKFWLDAAAKTCKSCIANCDTCTTATDCSKCTFSSYNLLTGDVSTFKKGTAECDTAFPRRCVGDKVTVKGVCTAVATPITNCLVFGHSNDDVVAKTFPAQTDQTKAVCVTCKTGYKLEAKKCVSSITCALDKNFVVASNSCVAGQKGCATKSADKTKCASCIDGYFFKTNTCTACPTGQKTCTETACVKPHVGYCAVKDNACAALANSKECGADGLAVSCIDGFIASADKKTCEACTIAFCKDCTAAKAKCPTANCKDGYYGAASNDKCTVCTAASKCKTCAEITKCKTCPTDYNLVSDKCETIVGCKKYTSNKKECTECKEAYGLLTDKTACVACATGYKTCNINCAGRGVGTCYDSANTDPNTCKCKNSKVWKLNKCVTASAAADSSSGGSSDSSTSSTGAASMTFQIVLFGLISMFLF